MLPRLQQLAIARTSLSEDATSKAAAIRLADEYDVRLTLRESDLLDFQLPYYRLMNFYLHAYLGQANPWNDDWPSGYEI